MVTSNPRGGPAKKYNTVDNEDRTKYIHAESTMQESGRFVGRLLLEPFLAAFCEFVQQEREIPDNEGEYHARVEFREVLELRLR